MAISVSGRDVCFYLGMGSLFAHELDAMTHHEWRLLPLLNALSDHLAKSSFVWLHVPLFALLIALVASRDLQVRFLSRVGISAFVVIHAALHTLLSGHVQYTFAGWTSHGLIYGGALLGVCALLLDLRFRLKNGKAHAGTV